MQSERNFHPCVSLVTKDNKSTYDKFLVHVFDFAKSYEMTEFQNLAGNSSKSMNPRT
jgi:hypothetical protein